MTDTNALYGDEGGCWIVTTNSSMYRFDLDMMVVTRIPGEFASRSVNDVTRPLLQILSCAVGEPGHWQMRPVGSEAALLDYFWQRSTVIRSIDRAPAGEPSKHEV